MMAIKRRIETWGGYPCKTRWITLRDAEDHNLTDEQLVLKHWGPPPPRSIPWAIFRLVLWLAYWTVLIGAIYEVATRR